MGESTVRITTKSAAVRADTSRRDPTDPMIVYAGSYGGEITRYDHRTSSTQNGAVAGESHRLGGCRCETPFPVDRTHRLLAP